MVFDEKYAKKSPENMSKIFDIGCSIQLALERLFPQKYLINA